MLPRMPPWVRYAVVGVIAASFGYAIVLLNGPVQAVEDELQVLLEGVLNLAQPNFPVL